MFRTYFILLRDFAFFATPCLYLCLVSSLRAESGTFSPSAIADTYTRVDLPSSNFGTENGLWVKKASTTASANGDRNLYLRFAATSFTNASSWIEQASLVLDATNRPGNGTTYFSFDLYGLPDGHPDEGFQETVLTFSNAFNSSTNQPGSFVTNGLVYLGSTKAISTNVPQAMVWNSPALREFIRGN
jgi:hypothetical protein